MQHRVQGNSSVKNRKAFSRLHEVLPVKSLDAVNFKLKSVSSVHINLLTENHQRIQFVEGLRNFGISLDSVLFFLFLSTDCYCPPHQTMTLSRSPGLSTLTQSSATIILYAGRSSPGWLSESSFLESNSSLHIFLI